ncbi:hypothetical protein VE04_06299 [Pseudogymnoascus sp. 24MN13]|nr:hypothetical protein VE04_06299 [Pseudogymnoascus sp. 24MN13]
MLAAVSLLGLLKESADMDLSATLLQLLLVLVTAMQRPNAVNMQRYLERHVLFLPVVQNGVSGKSLSITEIQVFCIESSRALLFGQRLSLHAFLGTTTEFCADLCQNNCFEPTEPSCTSNDVLKKVIGYYESWSSDRACDGWGPSDISANGLTHVFYSFALFEEYDSDWNVYIPALDQAQTEAEMLKPFMALKQKNPGLSTVISVGGWSFNDPPTAGYWSTMSSTAAGRNSFAKNLLAFMVLYGFDGVDLDWEYPGASDRGGDTTLWVDSDNYIALIREIRMVFDATGTAYTISFTTPASYWYLQTFQVNEMLSAGADWTMMMTYDLHGVWDGDDPYIEIKVGLDLLWRTNVDPSQVLMGIGFYGRSFTLSDIGCQDPGCPFDSAGVPGVCTATAGILSYKEITAIVTAGEGTPVWNEEAAVNYLTFADNQWVSYDNNVTFKQKVDYANQICLGGVGIWAIDLDTYDWQALSALTGKDINGGSLLTSGGDPTELASAYNAYTGADCYVSGCVDWNTGSCKAGYSVLDYVHSGSMGVIEDPDKNLCRRGDVSVEESTDSQYRLICCPTDAMPVSCSWEGAGAGVGFALFPQFCKGGGSGFCGAGKFELIADSYTERTGSTPCILNKRSLCCATDPELELCSWTACGDSCLETQYKNPNTSVYGGSNLNQDSELCADGANPAGPSSFCCPNTYTGCAWYGDDYCTKSCPSDKILITQRSEIEDLQIEQGLPGGYDECVTGYLKYCCDPPTATTDWPVSPTDLFEYPDTTHVSYEYVKEDSSYDDYDREEDGPFAFVMIDGDTAAYSESLVDQWGFLDDDSNLSKRKIKKRDMFTKQNDTFDNVVETYTIKCLNLAGCEGLFEKGASNTIVKLPDSIGAGPYARIISLEPIGSTKRSSNIVPRSVGDTYNLVVDYDLAGAAVEQKGDVNFRIDYSNLVDYWADVTDTPAKNRKRWFGAFKAWLAKVTTMVKSDTGFLPLEYEENIKLFHFAKTCPKTNLKTTLDLDANIHMGLYAQYAYYFEGSILPTPTLIASYGYFSVSPAADILMTLRGEAIIQTNSDVVNILSGITLPGLSIKGLISIGPEFDLTGSMDASLQVSGELNAGVSVAWPKAEVFFPQDSDGSGATIPPGTLDDPNDPDKQQTFSVVPTFDASITAVGNLARKL